MALKSVTKLLKKIFAFRGTAVVYTAVSLLQIKRIDFNHHFINRNLKYYKPRVLIKYNCKYVNKEVLIVFIIFIFI